MNPERVFVDTSGFYALLKKDEAHHKSAVTLMKKAAATAQGFVTTDYILDETATLLVARGAAHLAVYLFELIESSRSIVVEFMDEDRFTQTKAFFFKHSDQGFSFSDCFSFVIMKELKLKKALTTDEHFRIAKFEPLL